MTLAAQYQDYVVPLMESTFKTMIGEPSSFMLFLCSIRSSSWHRTINHGFSERCSKRSAVLCDRKMRC